VQCRADDIRTIALLSAIDDPAIRAAAEDERARLHVLERKRIVITRPRGQALSFAAALARYGAVPILCPVIRIDSLPDSAVLDTALRQLGRYDWIVFTSVNGVTHFWSRVSALQIEQPLLDSLRLAAVGPATAHALARVGLHAQLIPVQYVAEHLADAFGDVRGQSFFLPRSAIARDTLAKTLRQRGASVDDVPIYQTTPETPDATELRELNAGVDVVSFTSASAVRAFAQVLPPSELASVGRALIACIGPVTAAAARDAGFSVDIMADEYTTDGIVQALVRHFGADMHASRLQPAV
jgi:uroporphyrinogen III methyltransferase/synthase